MTCCCACFKPRYQRLVDRIYPKNSQDGVVKSRLENLCYYACTCSPDKLDKIGVYMENRLEHDLARKRYENVMISMEAIDKLLSSCRSRSLNLFASSFIAMVQLLLESDKVFLKSRATESFLGFCRIQEETPSYHRPYTHIVRLFCAMSYTSNTAADWEDDRLKCRISGIKGLDGIVRKTASDEHGGFNIYTDQIASYMVPALLMNFETNGPNAEGDSELDNIEVNTPFVTNSDDPCKLADNCMRDLFHGCGYSTLKHLMIPLLTYLDEDRWQPPYFAKKCISLVMTSINAQYAFEAIKLLLNHLANPSFNPKLKTAILEVIGDAVAIANTAAIAHSELIFKNEMKNVLLEMKAMGPSVLDVFHKMLHHLQSSIECQITSRNVNLADELEYQNAIINIMGTYAVNLPDFQKIDIMIFLMSKMPEKGIINPENHLESEWLLLNIILKCVKSVAQKYTTVHLRDTFKNSLRDPLLQVSLSPDPDVRVLVQEILHTLIDRHNNTDRLREIQFVNSRDELQLIWEKPHKQDLSFMNWHGPQLYQYLFESLFKEQNTDACYNALYCTLALLCVEVGSDFDSLLEIIRFLLGAQDTAVNNDFNRSTEEVARVHTVVAAVFNLVGKIFLFTFPELDRHVMQIVNKRRDEGKFLLHNLCSSQFISKQKPANHSDNIITESDEYLFKLNQIQSAINPSGTAERQISTIYTPQKELSLANRRQSIVPVDVTRLADVNCQFDSNNSSPVSMRRFIPEDITPSGLRKIFVESVGDEKDAEEMRNKSIISKYRNNTFSQILQSNVAQHQFHRDRWSAILQQADECSIISKMKTCGQSYVECDNNIPTYEMDFPTEFLY